MVENGDRVKDLCSDYQGIVIATTTYLNGCRRVLVQVEKTTKDGTLPDPVSFDENGVTILKKGVVKGFQQVTGGPRPMARQARHA